jgi:hypothetical protein
MAVRKKTKVVVKSKVAARGKSKVASASKIVKSKSKVVAKRGRPTNSSKNEKAKAADRRAYAFDYYVKNRAKILKKTMKYYRAHRSHIIARVNKWRKKTKNGARPLYMQGKATGRKPLHDRMVRLNGKGKGRDLTTGKNPQTTMAGRTRVRKSEERVDEKKEKGKRPKVMKRTVKVVKKATRRSPMR